MALGVARSLIDSGGVFDGVSLIEILASSYEPSARLRQRWRSGSCTAATRWSWKPQRAALAALTHKSDVAIDAAVIHAAAVAAALATQRLEPAKFIDSVAGAGVLAAKVRSIPSLV